MSKGSKKDPRKQIVGVIVPKTDLGGLYDTRTGCETPIAVNISAIVGKNGSGKSTLIELLFAAVYLFSSHIKVLSNIEEMDAEIAKRQEQVKNHLEEKDETNVANGFYKLMLRRLKQKSNAKKIFELKSVHLELEKEKTKNQKRLSFLEKTISELQGARAELNAMQSGLKVEIIYQIDNQIFKLSINGEDEGKTSKVLLVTSNLPKTEDTVTQLEIDNYSYQSTLAETFFYTISVNYSHYSLNASVMGRWINSLFHKNDGYKTPVVINPMRTDGNFVINAEIARAKYRLLANLMIQKYTLKEKKIYLTDKQYVSKVRFTLASGKLGKESVKRELNKTTASPEIDIISNNVFARLGLDDQKVLYSNTHPFQLEMDTYIVKKVKRIAEQYDEYNRVGEMDDFGNEITYKEITEDLLKEGSHVGFKLKQVTNFFKYSRSTKDANKFKEGKKIEYYDFTLDELLEWASDATAADMIAHLPPAFFDIEIFLKDDWAGEESLFSELSSGEQQLIHASQSMIYHINNLNSVSESQFDRVKYRNLNIVYDEIELYFHPEYQRRFISNILKSLKNIYLGKKTCIKSINFMFLTHSPFILSDIPSSNILFLEEDASPARNTKEFRTFGANIHDLLKLSFFLKDGSMGKYAEQKINETIKYINYRRLKTEIDEMARSRKGEEAELLSLKRKQILELKKEVHNEDLDYHKELIASIDEPLLRNKMQEMLGHIDGQYRLKELSQRIAELKKEETKLKKNALHTTPDFK